ncbi:MAG: GtrA family protein [Clostridia bacterium]|nr:GtrA family protein [Clostridia bacterium]
MDKLFEKIHEICGKFIKSEKLMDIIRKVVSKEVFFYLLFGVLTTVVNLVTLAIFNRFVDIMVSNIIAWVAAVVFAYVTNKLFVFESKSWRLDVIKKEIPSFTGARVLTLGIEELGILVMIKWLHLDVPLTIGPVGGEFIIKGILAVIVVLLNYVFSKMLIFKKK